MQHPWFSNSKEALIQPTTPFVKMHGLQNDFVIVDGRKATFCPSTEEIVHICDRREGVGADELLIVEPARTLNTHAFVKIFNPDGREVEACGNATRCIGWLLLKECNQKEIRIETLGGVLTCSLAGEKLVRVEMGRIKTLWQDIPLSEEMDTLHLNIEAGPLNDPVGMNIGNPHAIFFVEDADAIDLSKYGKILQTHPLFPEEANIGVAQLLDPETLKLMVWERPGVMTTACGTGACVAVAAAHRRGLTKKKCMTVIMPAGTVEIELKNQNIAVMTGPVEICYVGYLSKRYIRTAV
ncbi:MAG: diaminopimelate epimerase [Thermodesulfobacteriota bacterium]